MRALAGAIIVTGTVLLVVVMHMLARSHARSTASSGTHACAGHGSMVLALAVIVALVLAGCIGTKAGSGAHRGIVIRIVIDILCAFGVVAT